jgi:plastocyanin
MAEKSFGVKDLNMVGSSGDPTIESNGDLNLKAGQVAIQTNTTVTGVVTATSFVGGGAGITGISTTNITNYQVGSGGGVTVEDEGSALSTTATTLNFVGDGVVASGTGAEKTITVAGGSVPANLTATTLNVSGIVTAGSFVSDLISGNGTDRGFCTRYYVTANGASSYRFAGPGILNSIDNPTLYLHRGFTYMFENSTGSSHPFRIQFTGTSTGVGTYVSGDQNGVQIFTIPHTAPANYEYICTIHGGMKGSFIIPS